MDKNNNQYQNWQHSFNRFFGNEFWSDFKDMFHNDNPPYNLYESPSHLLCIISLPGLNNLNDMSMYTNHTTLTVKGKLQYNFDGYHILSNELFQGSFQREIPLPYPVENKPVQATYERGLLIVKLHRLLNEDEQELIIIEDRDQL